MGGVKNTDSCGLTYNGKKSKNYPIKVPENVAKRMIVIDAQNLMHLDLGRERKIDCCTVLPVVRYFIIRGHRVKIVLPEFVTTKKKQLSRQVWKDLRALKLLVTVPYSKHDDLVALSIAKDSCGSIITKDKFRDHKASFPHFRDVLLRNIELRYSKKTANSKFFVDEEGDKYYMHKFVCDNYAKEQFFSFPDDEDYLTVKSKMWPANQKQKVIERIDQIFESVQRRIAAENQEVLRRWRHVATKEELKYQLQGCECRCDDFTNCGCDKNSAFVRFIPSSFSRTAENNNIVADANLSALEVLPLVSNSQSFSTWFGQVAENELFKDDLRAESKIRIWRTLTGDMEVDKESLYNFLLSFQGILKEEFVLNEYYDHIDSHA